MLDPIFGACVKSWIMQTCVSKFSKLLWFIMYIILAENWVLCITRHCNAVTCKWSQCLCRSLRLYFRWSIPPIGRFRSSVKDFSSCSTIFNSIEFVFDCCKKNCQIFYSIAWMRMIGGRLVLWFVNWSASHEAWGLIAAETVWLSLLHALTEVIKLWTSTLSIFSL